MRGLRRQSDCTTPMIPAHETIWKSKVASGLARPARSSVIGATPHSK
jgi:hypothetical protein